ncbi:hypothetical protein COV20_01180 [Candidatus Woesearchaeota archaeon CG10_big_fil_rev_8_21_14_0_10_45_16]|nr:MAG: hypothetical protein COV20_01180 [Candidatus Woesearchaeota archaeon CG10_big_fil_rev_8_21_14_0_10_45_16]
MLRSHGMQPNTYQEQKPLNILVISILTRYGGVVYMDISPIIKDDFLAVEDTAMLSEALGQLRQYDKRAALIFRNKKYQGLIERKRLLTTNIDATNTKIGKYVHMTPIVSDHADILETAVYLADTESDYLPVQNNRTIVGVVHALDLAKLAMTLPETSKLKVSDIKLLKPRKVNSTDSLSVVLEIMKKEHVDHVPVFKDNALFGIVSFRDLLRKYINWSPKRDFSAKFNKEASSRAARVDISPLASLPVQNFSTNDNLVKIKSSATLLEAVTLLFKNNIRNLIVTEDNQYLGLLSLRNILTAVSKLKVQKNYNIKFVGLNKLDWHPSEKEALKKIASNESFKLQRILKNEFSLIIHLKEYEKEGQKHKYSVTMRVDFPGRNISISQDDWDWRTAVRKTFANAKNKLGKQFKV